MEPNDKLHTVELSLRKKVNRRGGEVRRPVAAWTTSVHAFLHHLEKVGFQGAPRVIQREPIPQDFDIVEFVEGEVDSARVWTEEGMFELGRLMRKLHAASESFEPPPDSVWQEWFMRSHQTNAIFSHCDVAPWNIVTRNGLPVALIDWELAGPVDRLTELAHTGWLNAGLFDDEIAEQQGLPPAQIRIRQLRAFVDGYELPTEERVALVDRMIEVAVLSAASDVIEAGITPESVDESWIVWGVAWRTRSAAWMIQNRASLERAMSGTSQSFPHNEMSGAKITFIVVSGPPASGKTTLAAAIASELRLPLISKDTIKDALMDVLPVPDVETSRQIGGAAVRAMLAVAAASPVGAVVESNFYRSVAGPEIAKLPGQIVEVFCRCDAETAASRYKVRVGSRHAGHFDQVRTREELWNEDVCDPVGDGWPVIEVDTNEPVDLRQLIVHLQEVIETGLEKRGRSTG